MQRRTLATPGSLVSFSVRCSWLAAVGILLVAPATPCAAQFRDVTPRAPGEAKQELTPEPMPEVEVDEALEPQPIAEGAETALEPIEAPGPDADEIAAREAELQAKIEDTLVDDTGVRPLPFRGVMPGESTESEVREVWGDPFRELEGKKSKMLKYRLSPFRQVDVTILGKKVSSVLIHLDGLLSPEHVEEELRMTKLEPTTVRDEFGRPIGLAYPERGVLLGYDSSDPDALIAKIQLEQVTPEPFVLRAQNDRDYQYEANLADLQTALDMNGKYALGHWVRAEQFATVGRFHDGLACSAKATNLDPNNALFVLTRIRLMAENGNRSMALRETKHLLQQPDLDAEVEAAALSMMGNLVSMGLSGNHKGAMQAHLEAIDIASKLVNDPERERRHLAKETLIRSHLAVARNISMGDFQKQESVVPKWLSRSRALIDEYVKNERGDRALYLDLYRQILATAADIRNPEDPNHVIDQLQMESKRQLSSTNDALRENTINWKLGAGLAEAVRLQRQRGQDEAALKLADQAMSLLRSSAKRRQSTPEQTYLIGRLYFHIGSLHAVQRGNHDEAIMWYKKAEPLLADEQPTALLADPATHGEMFISMGVSYWDFGDQQKAIDITEFGTDYLQRAVVDGILDTNVLSIPYGNLATMHMKNGNNQEAKAFAELAAEIEAASVLR